ncbi:MAG: NADH-quinone oxidoreductase subunit A [Holosporales bacterium]|jgi:NADH-quinone oxidoreductase subunit A
MYKWFDSSLVENLQEYIPLFFFVVLGLIIGCVMTFLSWFLGKRRPDPAKLSTYECGFDPIGKLRAKFDVRFYLVAILFIIFDIEIAFLFPWAVAFEQIGFWGYISMMIFLLILTVGFVYEWRKGALEWE